MRIKRLELCGFKSFVDATSLEFSRGISGIVGPNGCGKSNLVDALRWVLGEQSAKRLRGDAMEDVIFNGTDGPRGPAGMAEVSLILENEEPAEATEETSEIIRQLRDLPEIQITRRYFRSGESEYLINNRPCRLKDVTELFLGTGVGTKAYAMIEQGRVDQLVNAKPEDIRLFIEEAAGTTLYRDRRLAAERKIERTRDNLARVTDILQEIDRNIALYRRLAKRAEQYRQSQQELRAVELQLGRRRLDRLDREIAELDGRRAALRDREDELVRAIADLDRDRESARARLAQAEGELRARQEALFEVRTVRGSSQTRLEMLDREEHDAGANLQRLARDREQTEIRVGELAGEIEQRLRVIDSLAEQNHDRETRLAASVETVSDEERSVDTLAAEVERAKSENVEHQRAESELRNRLRAAEERRAERDARRAAIAAEIAAAQSESARLAAETERLSAGRATLDAKLAAARDELARVAQAIGELRADKTAVEQAAIAAAAAAAEAQSRLGAAQDVERSYGRYDEGVRAVMRRHAEKRNGVLNLVAEIIDTPPEFEKAVAAVLGERLQYVVVRSPEDARDAIRELKEDAAGRSNFIPVEPRQPHAGPAVRDGVTGLLDVVRVEEGYGRLAESLLGDAVVVDDLDRGIELWRANGHWRTLVTREGEVVHPDGVVSGGSAPSEERLLAQRREIRRLQEEAQRLAAHAVELEARRHQRAAELANTERRAGGVDETLRALTIEHVGVEKDAERVHRDAQRVRDALQRAESEARRLEQELAAFVAEIAAAEREISQASAAREQGDRRRRELEDALTTRRAALEADSSAATELKIALAQSREKEDALRLGLEQMIRQRRELAQRLEQLAAEAAALELRAAQRADEQASLGAALEQSAAEEGARSVEFERSREAEQALGREIEDAEHRLSELRAAVDAARQERAADDVAAAQRGAHREHAIGAIRERYQVELADVAIAEADEADLEARCQALQQKVDRMDRSTVGIEAMEELGSMEARREFLAKEQADLERSVADLQKTIASLNRISRDRFAETFAAVDAKFQETFPKLFRGGRARLALTDENDLMGTGVDIHVQPPGMNLRALSLLSGGQKALTAVSLIFSLFMCRPSPFCVLDEVDAPLDDANIDRFNQIVTEMGRDSQFLIITHNQRTMEMADRLYGVTMDEPGVSRIVSVKLQS
jgi:chromosome segregation protein